VINDTSSILLVLLAAAIAPLLVAGATRSIRALVIPIAVTELVLGAVIGPHAANIAHSDSTLQFLSTLGLGFLFFFAGYEIDFRKIRGEPTRLALWGWAMSLAIAYSFAGLLAAAGVVISGLLTGSAMSTTAIGTILPVLRDTGQLKGRFGPSMLAAGAIGELGPLLIITLLLTTTSDAGSQAVLLTTFVVAASLTALLSTGLVERSWSFLDRSLKTSGQIPVRLTVLLIFGLVVLASRLGLDVILGAFAAGIIVRLVLRAHDAELFESKLEAVGFGFLIPFFFISSGMNLDLAALGSSPVAALKVPLFLFGFLLVRGTPALLLYRRTLDFTDRLALALFSASQLPLVVAITDIGVAEHQMRQQTAVALVAAGVLSVLVFPTAAIVLRRRGAIASAGAEPSLAGAQPTH
jgi:Kef-type K+ transport system membrane component KefB